MTDRLTTLLAHEAATVTVPPAPAAAVLARGRGLHRRRRGAAAAGTLALAAVVALGAATLRPDEGTRGVDPVDRVRVPDHPSVDVGAAFAIGSTVYLDGGRISATIDDPTLRTLRYTSAGVVAQGLDPDASDDSAVRTTAIGPDGVARDLDVPGGVTFDTDSDLPLMAWTEVVDGTVTVVVLDVVTGERVTEVEVPEHPGGFAPAALDGDHVYVGDATGGEPRVLDVDWRTGTTTVADGLTFVDEIAGGRSNLGYGGPVAVVDIASGERLVEVDTTTESASYFRLSPDGRFAVLTDQSSYGGPLPVYDVATGSRREFPGKDAFGWTADGDLVFLDAGGGLTTCDAATGACASSRPDLLEPPGDEVVMGGTGGSS